MIQLIKKYAKGFYMSMGMFCGIPLPFHLWDDDCKHFMLPFFPIVGLLLGGLWWGAALILIFFNIHVVLASAVLAILPFMLTGFLHLDGYMDTSDAVLSRRPLSDKLRILKDPHTGAFAVIALAVLFVLQFAAVYVAIDEGRMFLSVVFIAVIVRCCASFSLLTLKVMPQSGYANMLRQNTRSGHKGFIIAVAVLMTAAAYWFVGMGGLVIVLAVILGYAGAMAYAYNNFKGVSGDLAGFALVIGELCGLIALAVLEWGG